MNFVIVAVIFQLLSIPSVLLPRFEEFSVKEGFKGPRAVPVLSRPEERRFRTVIGQGAKAGPNFGGHYTIVEWGCGTECIQAAIVDSKTGRVYQPPFGEKGDRYFATTWLHFQLNSRLIVACTDCRQWNREDCDQHYFLWDGESLMEINRSPRRDSHGHY
jgi:hypothetical protein